jgi:hypothetical protein
VLSVPAGRAPRCTSIRASGPHHVQRGLCHPCCDTQSSFAGPCLACQMGPRTCSGVSGTAPPAWNGAQHNLYTFFPWQHGHVSLGGSLSLCAPNPPLPAEATWVAGAASHCWCVKPLLPMGQGCTFTCKDLCTTPPKMLRVLAALRELEPTVAVLPCTKVVASISRGCCDGCNLFRYVKDLRFT